MVVDAEIHEDVRKTCVATVALDDEERRGLLAASVATCGLGGGERIEEAFGERLARARLERLDKRVDRVAGDEDVPLRRVGVAGAATCPAWQPEPVNVAEPPCASTIPSWRCSWSSSADVSRSTTSLRASPWRRSASPSGP